MSRSLRFRLVVFLIGLFTAMALRGPSKSDIPDKLAADGKCTGGKTAKLPASR